MELPSVVILRDVAFLILRTVDNCVQCSTVQYTTLHVWLSAKNVKLK